MVFRTFKLETKKSTYRLSSLGGCCFTLGLLTRHDVNGGGQRHEIQVIRPCNITDLQTRFLSTMPKTVYELVRNSPTLGSLSSERTDHPDSACFALLANSSFRFAANSTLDVRVVRVDCLSDVSADLHAFTQPTDKLGTVVQGRALTIAVYTDHLNLARLIHRTVRLRKEHKYQCSIRGSTLRTPRDLFCIVLYKEYGIRYKSYGI